MKIYKIEQNVDNGYDTYDSAIVCAESEEEAKKIHPSGDGETQAKATKYDCWCGLKDVNVEYLGEAKEELKKGVIVASFNAG